MLYIKPLVSHLSPPCPPPPSPSPMLYPWPPHLFFAPMAQFFPMVYSCFKKFLIVRHIRYRYWFIPWMPFKPPVPLEEHFLAFFSIYDLERIVRKQTLPGALSPECRQYCYKKLNGRHRVWSTLVVADSLTQEKTTGSSNSLFFITFILHLHLHRWSHGPPHTVHTVSWWLSSVYISSASYSG